MIKHTTLTFGKADPRAAFLIVDHANHGAKARRWSTADRRPLYALNGVPC